MSRFMKSSDVYKSNSPDAASWSDSDGFYQRVNWLSLESHSASNDDEDVKDYFMCLEQLHLEIEGAITQEPDRIEIERIRKKVRLWVYNNTNLSKNLAIKREVVREYHSIINAACHRYGLFLKKTLKKTLDHWNNDNKQNFKGWDGIKIELQTDRKNPL